MCNLWYIGYSTQKLRARISSHKTDLSQARAGADTSDYCGFGAHGSYCSDPQGLGYTVAVLDQLLPVSKDEDPKVTERRLTDRETFFIRTMGVLSPDGLNLHESKKPFVSRHIFDAMISDRELEIARLNEELRLAWGFYGQDTSALKSIIRKQEDGDPVGDLPELKNASAEFDCRKTQKIHYPK